jgi:hypothetical protein
MHIYGVALLERFPGQCKTYAQGLLKSLGDTIANQTLVCSIVEPGIFPPTAAINQSRSVSRLIQNIFWAVPHASRTPYKDVTLLPLFEALGVDRFFKVFSAALCERRILFVADDINLLSTVILSTAAILHPFCWSHTLIIVLPHKLLAQVTASMPYLIGIKRQSYGALKSEQLDGVMVVDLDQEEVVAHGDFPMKDLVGDAGTALKQASEGLDRVRAGVASVFLGKNSTDTSDSYNQRDIMPMLLLDLKSALSAKPGSSSIQSVASGFLRGFPGGSMSLAESKAQWSLEAERTLRDALTCFFVFLFVIS